MKQRDLAGSLVLLILERMGVAFRRLQRSFVKEEQR